VELAGWIGGAPIAREEQGDESPTFRGYFGNKWEVAEGGTPNRFRNYATTPIQVSHLPNYRPPRLYLFLHRNSRHGGNARGIGAEENIRVKLVQFHYGFWKFPGGFLVDSGERLWVGTGEAGETRLGFAALQAATIVNAQFRNREAKITDFSGLAKYLSCGRSLIWLVQEEM
jgi:hypothetical protein